VRNDAFRDLMSFQVRRARDFYAKGTAGIPMLHQQGRFAVKVASDVYERILTRIERSDYDVFETRAVVPRIEKYWLTTRNLSLPIARYSMHKLAFWDA
jgi:phytoene synthase